MGRRKLGPTSVRYTLVTRHGCNSATAHSRNQSYSQAAAHIRYYYSPNCKARDFSWPDATLAFYVAPTSSNCYLAGRAQILPHGAGSAISVILGVGDYGLLVGICVFSSCSTICICRQRSSSTPGLRVCPCIVDGSRVAEMRMRRTGVPMPNAGRPLEHDEAAIICRGDETLTRFWRRPTGCMVSVGRPESKGVTCDPSCNGTPLTPNRGWPVLRPHIWMRTRGQAPLSFPFINPHLSQRHRQANVHRDPKYLPVIRRYDRFHIGERSARANRFDAAAVDVGVAPTLFPHHRQPIFDCFPCDLRRSICA